MSYIFNLTYIPNDMYNLQTLLQQINAEASSSIDSLLWDTPSSNLTLITNNTISSTTLTSISSLLTSYTNIDFIPETISTPGWVSSSNASTGSFVLMKGGLGIATTVNSSNVSVGGALTIAGGAAISKDIYIGGTMNSTVISTGALSISGIIETLGGISLKSSSTNGNVFLKAHPGTTSYTMGMPLTKSSNSNNVLYMNTVGNLSVNPMPLGFMYSGTSLITNNVTYTGTSTVSGGRASFILTTTGTTSGTALFTSIDYINANARVSTGNTIAVALCGLNTVSNDLKSITVNVVRGTTVVIGGGTIVTAPDGTLVYAYVIGRNSNW